MNVDLIDEFEKDFENLIRKYMDVIQAGTILKKVLEVILSISLVAAHRYKQEKIFKEQILNDVNNIIDRQLRSLAIAILEKKIRDCGDGEV